MRRALALSPFARDALAAGWRYRTGAGEAATAADLQRLFIAAGSREMFARIATKRVDGPDKADDHNIHTLARGLDLCRLAASLGVPINVEVMCAATYMDMFEQQAPDFAEYPELADVQAGRRWQDLGLDTMAEVLRAYGDLLGALLRETGCRIDHFNLGNEANFGFAGLGAGLEAAAAPELADLTDPRRHFQRALLQPGWFARHVWGPNADLLVALREGLRQHFPEARFGTHVAIVSPRVAALQFATYVDRGYDLDDPGVSFYPTSPGVPGDKFRLFKWTVTAVRAAVDRPVFVAEYAFPSSSDVAPPYEWNRPLRGYPLDEDGQRRHYLDLEAWSMEHGVSGVRWWAPDFPGWGPMSLFDFDHDARVATPKALLEDLIRVE